MNSQADAVLSGEARSYVHAGDALRFLRALPDGAVDAVITDPPYASGGMSLAARRASTSRKYVSGDRRSELPEFAGDHRDPRAQLVWCELWMFEALRVTKPGGHFLCFTDWRQYPTFADAVQCAGWLWSGTVVWDKTQACRPRPNGFRAQSEFALWGLKPGGPKIENDVALYLPGVFTVRTEQDKPHIAAKPLALMRQLVTIAPPDGIVLDPFVGSGTTGAAAIEAGRRFLGCEVVPFFQAYAAGRLGRFAGASPIDTDRAA
jgi:site-specific DNA-methyltransferase (adenine-specific)